ncbi:MAG: ABC transporter substrate-binding protein [Propionibacteriaceae bacterium]|nr:ABC transporter substrate-binding protein [Propionibacteriaceae bacterium]
MSGFSRAKALVLSLSLVGAGLLGGCSGSGGSAVNLGYFPNLTHAPALVGLDQGFFAKALGDATLNTVTFNAGPSAIEALNAGSVDITFIGPNPTITGFTASDGQALRVIAGAAANGAALVVADGITDAAGLAGKKIATPQLGNTQDVALRYWLSEQGYETNTEGGGDVSIMPQDNGTALQAFITGEIDGAWVPEPWATRMVLEGGGHVLVDEATIWPGGKFIVTNVIVRTEFLEQHPEQVEAVLTGLLDSLDYIEQNPAESKAIVNKSIEAITGSGMDDAVLDSAWGNVVFTYDPLAATLRESAAHATAVGLLEEADLTGLYALDPLNKLLAARGLPEVTDE